MWGELSIFSPPYNIDTEFYLCDYIPYAKYGTYFDILFNSGHTYPALFYGIKEDTVIEELDSARDNATLFLYQKCKKDFTEFFLEFAEEHTSFHKLDKIIINDLLSSFIIILESHKPDSNSLGLRVRNLIRADLSHCASMIAENDFNTYRTSLNRASTEYILALEHIQEQTL